MFGFGGGASQRSVHLPVCCRKLLRGNGGAVAAAVAWAGVVPGIAAAVDSTTNVTAGRHPCRPASAGPPPRKQR